MKLNHTSTAILVLIFGTIMVSSALGLWQTETTKIPARFSQGGAAGEYNPADIRGSYTFGDVSRLFEIPLEDLQQAYDLPAENPSAFALKDLEARFEPLGVELGTGSVRLFTALYKGLPYDLTLVDDFVLKAGADILKAKAVLDPDQMAYLDAHIVDPSGATLPLETPNAKLEEAPAISTPQPGTGGGSNASPSSEHTPKPGSVTGKTSFQNLLDCGVEQADIEALIGQKLPAKSMLLKDWVTSKNFNFTEYRAKFQALVDAAQ